MNEIELRSEEVREVLSKVPRWYIRWGNLLILILVLGLIALSWFIKYPDLIKANAVVTSIIPPQKIYSNTIGRIDSIFVKDNEKVYPNQPIALIENTSVYADVMFLKSIIDSIDVHNLNIKYDSEELPVLFLGDIEADYADFELAYISYELNLKLKPFSNESKAINYSLIELSNRLTNVELQKEINASEVEYKKKDLERYRTLFEKGVVSEKEYEEKQIEFLKEERNLKNMNSHISQLKQELGVTKKDAIGNSIEKSKEELILFKNLIQSINKLKKSIKNWELNFVLQSKITGTVSYLDAWNKNQNVKTGDLLFTVIPDDGLGYIVKMNTLANNSGKIKENQKVLISLQSYPESEFGVLSARVKNISLTPDDDGYYRIEASLDNELVTSYNQLIQFKQEMRGEAEIITEDIRLINRIFYKFREILDR